MLHRCQLNPARDNVAEGERLKLYRKKADKHRTIKIDTDNILLLGLARTEDQL